MTAHDEDHLQTPTADELVDAGVKVRPDTDPQSCGHDQLERFLRVQNHAMFLFTSEDSVIDRYIRDHWAALDRLSGEACDIHVSLFQLVGGEDIYSELSEIRSISGLESIAVTNLPALHLWSTKSTCTVPLRAVDTEPKLRDLLRSVFSIVQKIGGPIAPEHNDLLQNAAANVTVTFTQVTSNQAIKDSSAARDIIQTTNQYHYHLNTASKEKIMGNLPGTRTRDVASPPATDKSHSSQIIEDVKAGDRIAQTTDSPTDGQIIRRAETPGSVVQRKAAPSEMSFGWGKAKGLGIIGLVVAFLAWLAYMYFSAR